MQASFNEKKIKQKTRRQVEETHWKKKWGGEGVDASVQ